MDDASLPDGWKVGQFGDSLICPDGLEIEPDGECPNGHASPLREMGLL
jgi:hypothetical protein